MQLKPNTELQGGKYRILRVLGQGGFGITYLAENTFFEKMVAIKEFFPKDFCGRDNTSHLTLGTQNNAETVGKLKARFLKEAKNIANLDHPGIIKIHDIFEENDTAYYVMDYIDGENLNQMVKRNGPLSESKAIEYITKVGEALEYIHSRNMTHFDVKPANIMVRRSDNEPILIDFGLSKQYDKSGDATSTMMQGVSQGYSPIELYNMGSITTFSPQTDVYSLGATLYYLLIGNVPPSASALLENRISIPTGISVINSSAIKAALSVSRIKRPQNIRIFLEQLSINNHAHISQKQSLSETGEDTIYLNSSSGDVNNPQNSSTQCIDNESELIDPEIENSCKRSEFNKYITYIGLLLVVAIGICFYSFYFSKPKPEISRIERVEGYVQNPNKILSHQEVHSLSELNTDINSKYGVNIVSLIIDNQDIEDLKQFSDSLFNAWGIGDADTNRGLLISINKTRREIAIITGIGMESVLTNDSCDRIISNMIPYCRDENYYKALKVASTDVSHMLDNSSTNKSEEIFIAVEQPAEFPGGLSSLKKWLRQNCQYPEVAQQNDIQGKVVVGFVVEKDGSIGEVSICQGIDEYLDKEALRVVRNMPKWYPAKNAGIPVRSYFTLPISFVLQE